MTSEHTASAYNLNLTRCPPYLTQGHFPPLLPAPPQPLIHFSSSSSSFGPLLPIGEVLQEVPVDTLGFLPLHLYAESPQNAHPCCPNSPPTSLAPPAPNGMPRRLISPQMSCIPPSSWTQPLCWKLAIPDAGTDAEPLMCECKLKALHKRDPQYPQKRGSPGRTSERPYKMKNTSCT